MRWKEKSEPPLGMTRKKTRFLLFPKRIGNETRWLEVCDFEETYSEKICLTRAGVPINRMCWVATKWL